MAILKIQAGRVVNATVDSYIGQFGVIFYDEAVGELRISDGVTPGGIKITQPGSGSGTIPVLEEAIMYARRIDFITDNLIYRGEAKPGSSDDSPVWRIYRIVISADGDVSESWANGNANFDKAWTDRLTLNYI